MLSKLIRAFRKMERVIRGALWRRLILLSGGECGRGLELERRFNLRWGPHPGIRLGENVRLGTGVVLDVPTGAALTIGDKAKVMHYTVIAASESVSIGARAQIGEFCSIRDSDHGGSNYHLPIGERNISTPTVVGTEVWIGRGVAVLRGAKVSDHAIVGANSVVTRHTTISEGATVVGIPARELTRRPGHVAG